MFQSNRQLLILSGLLGIVIAIVGQAITLGSPTIDESGGEQSLRAGEVHLAFQD